MTSDALTAAFRYMWEKLKSVGGDLELLGPPPNADGSNRTPLVSFNRYIFGETARKKFPHPRGIFESYKLFLELMNLSVIHLYYYYYYTH